jgi:AraC-like DNA-binding protein
MADVRPPTVGAWNTRLGLIEEYESPRAPAERGRLHVHQHIQICLSLDFPRRYAYRGRVHDVPIGALSALDAWEPHATSDPCDRDRLSHYVVMYVDPAEFRSSVDRPAATPLAAVVRTDELIVRRFRQLYRALAADELPLQQDERYRDLAAELLCPEGSRPHRHPAPSALRRAREYIAANACGRVYLRDVAAVADLTPWHFARAFRRQFGMPPHRLQLSLRIDHGRRLLAEGMGGCEVAQRAGFADQSHFIRSFKRVTGTTPARFQRLHRRRVAVAR